MSLDNEEKEEVDNNKRDAAGEDKYNNNIGMDRSQISRKIESQHASPVLSVDNAFGSVWSSSKNAMVNANTDGGVVADTASTLPAQNNTNDDPLFGLDSGRGHGDSDHDRAIGGGAWNASAATAGSHNARIGVNISNTPWTTPPVCATDFDLAHYLTSPRRYRTI